MIVSGPSSSGKTVFTKQVLNKSDKQFEKNLLVLFRMARRIQKLPGNQLCVGHAILTGGVPRIKWAQSHDCTRFHSETTPPKSKCHINSSKLILPGKGNEKRTSQYRVRGVISQSTR